MPKRQLEKTSLVKRLRFSLATERIVTINCMVAAFAIAALSVSLIYALV